MTETRPTVAYRPWLYGGGLAALVLAASGMEFQNPSLEKLKGRFSESLDTCTNLQAWTDLLEYRKIQKLQAQNDKKGYELAKAQEIETWQHANKVNQELSEWMKSESVIKFLNEELNLDARSYPREFLLRCWQLQELITKLQKDPFKLAEVVKAKEAKFFPHLKNFDPNKPEAIHVQVLSKELKAAKPEEREAIITKFATGEMRYAESLVLKNEI